MAKYNIIRNGLLTSTTSSGTGNKDLTSTELYSLIDNTTTTSGITLIQSDVLYLDVDLGHRIKVDGVNLYTSDLTKLSDIDFYYKNYVEDIFTTASKNVTTTYNAQLPYPSAPQYIRCTISGIDINILEFNISNDDQDISFGQDGTETNMWLSNTPLGSYGTPQSIDIFNNDFIDDKPSIAYICVDYTGEKDYYIQIAPTENGEFVGLESGSVVGYNNNNYWEIGSYDNTEKDVANNTILLDDESLGIGTYTTPILYLDDPFNSSYFIIDSDTVEGTTNISKTSELYNGTIEIRSSDVAPKSIDIIYLANDCIHSAYFDVGKYDFSTEVWDSDWHHGTWSELDYPGFCCVDRKRHRIIYTYARSTYSEKRLYVINYNNTIIHSNSQNDNFYRNISDTASVDTEGGIWTYSYYTDTLRHLKYNLSNLGNMTIEGYYSHDADINSDKCWYTDTGNNTVNRLNSSCDTIMASTHIEDPTGVCFAEDGGCWVIDNGDLKLGTTLKKLDSEGNIILNIAVNNSLYKLASDYLGGCYAIPNQDNAEVYHYTRTGTIDRTIAVTLPNNLKASKNGCVIHSTIQSKVSYYDYKLDTITWTKIISCRSVCPDIFSYDIELNREYFDYMGESLIPQPYDNTWYDNGNVANLSWVEVPKDGYFLPNNKYHQVRITLRNSDNLSTPTLKNISMAPTIKVADIQPGKSLPIYVRSNIPAAADIIQFNSRIKVWWDKSTI